MGSSDLSEEKCCKKARRQQPPEQQAPAGVDPAGRITDDSSGKGAGGTPVPDAPSQAEGGTLADTTQALGNLGLTLAHKLRIPAPGSSPKDHPSSPKKRKAASSIGKDAILQDEKVKRNNDMQGDISLARGALGQLLFEFDKMELNTDLMDAIRRTESRNDRAPDGDISARVDRSTFELAVASCLELIKCQITDINSEGNVSSIRIVRAYAVQAIAQFSSEDTLSSETEGLEKGILRVSLIDEADSRATARSPDTDCSGLAPPGKELEDAISENPPFKAVEGDKSQPQHIGFLSSGTRKSVFSLQMSSVESGRQSKLEDAAHCSELEPLQRDGPFMSSPSKTGRGDPENAEGSTGHVQDEVKEKEKVLSNGSVGKYPTGKSSEGQAGQTSNSIWGSTLVCADLTVDDVASKYWPFLRSAVEDETHTALSSEEEELVNRLVDSLNSSILDVLAGATQRPAQGVKSLIAATVFDDILRNYSFKDSEPLSSAG